MKPITLTVKGGIELSCAPLLAFDALDLIPTVLAIAAPIVAASDNPADATIGAVARALASPEHKGGFKSLVVAFIGTTTMRNGAVVRAFTQEDFNALFSGSYPDLLKWLGAHIQTNFSDFFATPPAK